MGKEEALSMHPSKNLLMDNLLIIIHEACNFVSYINFLDYGILTETKWYPNGNHGEIKT